MKNSKFKTQEVLFRESVEHGGSILLLSHHPKAQSAGAVEYTDYISAEE